MDRFCGILKISYLTFSNGEGKSETVVLGPEDGENLTYKEAVRKCFKKIIDRTLKEAEA